eukprot:299049-Pyramimonas_sp.AAC.1
MHRIRREWRGGPRVRTRRGDPIERDISRERPGPRLASCGGRPCLWRARTKRGPRRTQAVPQDLDDLDPRL